MINVNWDEVEESKSFEPLPEGDYPVMVSDVTTRFTETGDEQWKLDLEVLSGPHQGKIIKDSLFFTEKAFGRVKLVFSRLGIKLTGTMQPEPHQIKGKKAIVTVTIESREHKGQTYKNNKVTFAGYSPYNGAEAAVSPKQQAALDKMGDLPF